MVLQKLHKHQYPDYKYLTYLAVLSSSSLSSTEWNCTVMYLVYPLLKPNVAIVIDYVTGIGSTRMRNAATPCYCRFFLRLNIAWACVTFYTAILYGTLCGSKVIR
jgi:hypothetical protein